MSNNDIDNDLDVENFEDDSGFDDFNKKQKTLSHIHIAVMKIEKSN